MPKNLDLNYLLQRAEREAITAIVLDNTVGNTAHLELSRRYSAMVVRSLVERKKSPAHARADAAPPGGVGLVSSGSQKRLGRCGWKRGRKAR